MSSSKIFLLAAACGLLAPRGLLASQVLTFRLLLAEGAPVDTIGPIAGLVSALGSSGAAVFVAYLFLQFLRSTLQALFAQVQNVIEGLYKQMKEESDRRDDAWRQLADRHLDVMRQSIDAIRQSNEAMRAFTVSANGICRADPVAPPRRVT